MTSSCDHNRSVELKADLEGRIFRVICDDCGETIDKATTCPRCNGIMHTNNKRFDTADSDINVLVCNQFNDGFILCAYRTGHR